VRVIEGGEAMEGYRVVTAVGERHVGRIVDAQSDYYIVKRSFGRGCYPLPKKNAVVVPEQQQVLMHLPRRELFAAPKVRRGGELDPATDGHFNS
jgi:hypothetical protein